MRVGVITEATLGSTRAHAINVIKTAGGFERLGHEVTVYCAARGEGASGGAEVDAYGEGRLRVVSAPRTIFDTCRGDEDRSRALGEWAARRCLADGVELVYARHFWGALASADLGLATIMETHAHVGDPRLILDACFAATARRGNPLLGIATISPVLRDHYVQRGARATRVAIVPDGVDVEMFSPSGSLGANPFSEWSGPNAVYCGHLYDYKGVPTILSAAGGNPDVVWHLVGGDERDVARVRAEVERRQLANVVVHGNKVYSEVPRYLWHADVLVLPPERDHPSARWTSPVKLGEYLASGRSIVASDIPGLRTWVDEPAVRWFRASDGEDLGRAVREALALGEDERELQRGAAARLAMKFSYSERAKRILGLAGTRALQLAA